MKTKNLMIAFALLAIMLVLPFSVAAQSANANATANGAVGTTLTPDDQAEVATMQTQQGAQVRMLQLEKSIQANIVAGNEVISSINATNASVNTSELDAIVAELQALLDQIMEVDYNQSNKDLVTQFVAFKKQAITISQEFRELVRTIVSNDDAAQIRERIVAKEKESLGNYIQRIQEAKRKYNAERIRGFLNNSGIDNETMVQMYLNGETNLGQIIASVRKSVNALGPEKRREAQQKAKENEAKRNVFRSEVQERVHKNLQEKREEIESNIQERVQTRMLQLEKSIQANIVAGNEVISSINATNASVNTSELDAIVAKLQALLDQVVAVDYNQSNKDLVTQFVAFKKQAITISQEFRKLARTLVSNDDVVEIRGRIGAKENESLGDYAQGIKERAREHLKNGLEQIKERIGNGMENAFGHMNDVDSEANASANASDKNKADNGSDENIEVSAGFGVGTGGDSQ